MKKKWIKRGVAVIVFFLALFVADLIFNRGNAEITTDMSKATLPVVSIKTDQYKINTMYGYTSKRKEAYIKDSITPISEDRRISVVIDTYQADIRSVAYEVRSIDGERLIEGNDITVLQKMSDQIQFSIQLKDLTEENQEYSFVTILTLEGGEKVYYYARFIQKESYHEKEKLDFIMAFHETTLGTDGTEIKKYLESNAKGDNSNFHKVNINSSLAQVMWDGLSVERLEEPVILIKDITEQTASVVLQYLVKEGKSSGDSLYFVEEYYRVRYTPDRMYLLDYERTAQEIFDADKTSFYNDKIYLGITDEEVEMLESEGGKNLAFVNAGRLFIYNSVDNKLSEVFSFYNDSNFDFRTRNQNFEINLLKMEDSGNLMFMVAGYMNRGVHEGQVGMVVYYYDNLKNSIEEQAFLPYKKSADVLMQEIDNLCYLNMENHLFLILEGCLYDVDLEEKSYEVLVSDLTQDTYKVSQSGRMIGWLMESDPYDSQTLYWLNLNDRKQIELKAAYGERIGILGFMGEDLIYGLAKQGDIITESGGNILFPIYRLLIINQDKKVLKSYQKEDCYIVGCQLMENQITLNRVEKKAENTYEAIEDEHIASNDVQDGNVNRISVISEELHKKVVQIVLKSTVDTGSLKVMVPKEVIFEGGRDIALELEEKEDQLYVYGPRGVDMITSKAAEAVERAYELSGSVVDANGNYVWKKGLIYTKNQIMAITGTKADRENTILAVCLNTMLELEGIARVTQPMLDMGEDVFGILNQLLREERILDLKGCVLDSVLYYVDQDIPVLALMENGNAYLIVGFNEQNIVLMDPLSGTVYKKGMNDSRTMFEENGNRFITYIRYE